MSPVTLHLEYFGPYRDETVDFTKFSATPLFLISGKTGSGKTTIFDGMCYALFNQTSGVDREPKSMRSDFATHTDQTRVTFTFTHRNRSYEIVREPTQILAKKRGTGLTEAAASVTLTVFENGTEITQLTKEGQVRDYLQALLQMDGKQFAQIVLLPQGQFRRFLIAPSEDKAVVLEQLFNTTIFARWTDRLKRQLRQNEAANKETAATLDRLRGELQWTTENQEKAAALLANQQTTELLALMAEQQATTKTQRTAVTTQLKQADQLHSQLVRQDEQESVLLADRKRLTDRQQEQQTLTQQQPAMQTLKKRIAELDWTQQIQPQWQEQTQAQQTLQQRKQASVQAVTASQSAEQKYQAALADQQKQQPLVKKIKQENDQLAQQQELIPVYQHVAELTQQQQLAQEQSNQTQASLKQVRAAVSENQAAQQVQQRVLDQQTAISTRQNQLTQQGAQLQASDKQLATVRQADQQLTTSQQKVISLKAQALAAQGAAKEKRTAADAKYQAFLRSQIAELSAQLTEGSPCPVCGSEHHPHPAATTTATTVSEDAVKEIQAQADRLEKQASEVAAQFASWQERVTEQAATLAIQLAELQAALGQPTTATLDELTQQQRSAKQDYQQAEAKNEQERQALHQAQQQMKTLTAAATTLQTRVQTAEQTAHDQQTQTAKLSAELATEQKRLPDQAPTLAEFMQQVTDLQAQVKTDQQRLDAVNAAVQQAENQTAVAQSRVTQAEEEVQTSQQKLTQAQAVVAKLLTAHFGSTEETVIEQVQTALAEVGTLATKRQTLAAFDKRQDSLAATIADLVARTKDQPTPDREKTQAALTQAKAQMTALQEQQRQLQNLFEFNTTHAEQLQTQVDKQAAAMQTTQELTELSGVVNGDGPNSKLGLERYVLQTYLRQILRVGNHRLKQLTNGRYQFVIDESQANSKKRSGLEINVYDDHVGEQRSVHTLSGGESFIASLALALALGEVIQQTTGSVDVDALFIDEGFGSLDEDALMTALESLETIEGKHRMIGIISHVSELRDQVENQLQVIANGNGESTIRYHAAE